MTDSETRPDPSVDGIRAMLMRGGTSKGLYLLATDLPTDTAERDDLLLRVMGSPDPRQIDGVGGAHPLTSKVAVVSPSSDPRADIDYLFLQVAVDQPLVSDRQNCGNLLSGVGPFAVERGLIPVPVTPDAAEVSVRIRMVNTDGVATAVFRVEGGRPVYSGDTAIAGVPGTASPVRLDFEDTAGSSCGALLPTGSVVDTIAGTRVTCIDNGMPVIVVAAVELGLAGNEDCATLEADHSLRTRLEEVRLAAGPLMNLGDVAGTTVPKLTIVSPPRSGGSLTTRTFIPHRCHDAIGVLGAVSVATAALLPGSTAHPFLDAGAAPEGVIRLEHPTGVFDATVEVDPHSSPPTVHRSGIIRTARKLFDGVAFPRAR